jgi:hypothetical protein
MDCREEKNSNAQFGVRDDFPNWKMPATRVAQTVSLQLPGKVWPTEAPQTNSLRYPYPSVTCQIENC